MAYIKDNYDLWVNHDAEQQKLIDNLPLCYECDQPIQDDFCYEINGELVCGVCLNDNHRKETEDYIT